MQLVPATDELIAELTRYRQANNLTLLPAMGEETPLLLPIHGWLRPVTRSTVHLVVKSLFIRTATRLRVVNPVKADLLQQASAHWLRYTAGSRMADGRLDLRLNW